MKRATAYISSSSPSKHTQHPAMHHCLCQNRSKHHQHHASLEMAQCPHCSFCLHPRCLLWTASTRRSMTLVSVSVCSRGLPRVSVALDGALHRGTCSCVLLIAVLLVAIPKDESAMQEAAFMFARFAVVWLRRVAPTFEERR
jgi:hypothetical protein